MSSFFGGCIVLDISGSKSPSICVAVVSFLLVLLRFQFHCFSIYGYYGSDSNSRFIATDLPLPVFTSQICRSYKYTIATCS